MDVFQAVNDKKRTNERMEFSYLMKIYRFTIRLNIWTVHSRDGVTENYNSGFRLSDMTSRYSSSPSAVRGVPGGGGTAPGSQGRQGGEGWCPGVS